MCHYISENTYVNVSSMRISNPKQREHEYGIVPGDGFIGFGTRMHEMSIARYSY